MKPAVRRLVQSLASVLLAGLLTGCSTAFNKEWKAALLSPPQAGDLAGAWEGTWSSAPTSHTGRLRCIMVRKSATEYDAKFHANYKKVLSFSYTVPMEVQRVGDSWKFSGEADLGKLAGGVYTYEGASSARQFISTYHCARDHGKFEMTRPQPASP